MSARQLKLPIRGFAALCILVYLMAGSHTPATGQEQIAYNVITPKITSDEAPLNLGQLVARLRETPAIDIWSKLHLKNELEEILEGIARHFEGNSDHGIDVLRARFHALSDKTAAKLKNGDPRLSYTIAYSRNAIWKALIRR